MAALVADHRGNLSAIAKAIGCSRQFATRRLRALGLADAAAAARVAGGVPGQRQVLGAPAPARRARGAALRAQDDRGRADLLRALAVHRQDEDARTALGMPRRTFYRAKAAAGLTPADIDRERRRLAAGGDELAARIKAEDQAERGRLLRALAQHDSPEKARMALGLPRRTFERSLAWHKISAAAISRERRRISAQSSS